MKSKQKNVTLVVLAGIPGTGKTTIFRKVRSTLKTKKPFRYKLVRGVMNDEGDHVLGVYDGSAFEGSDKLSMAVQPDLIKFVNLLESKGKPVTIYAEGDRVTNASFIEEFQDQVNLFVVESDFVEQFREKRGIKQDEKFKKAKRTKVDGLIKKFSPEIVRNQNELDPDRIAELLCQYSRA